MENLDVLTEFSFFIVHPDGEEHLINSQVTTWKHARPIADRAKNKFRTSVKFGPCDSTEWSYAC